MLTMSTYLVENGMAFLLLQATLRDLAQVPVHVGDRVVFHGRIRARPVVARVHAKLVVLDDALVGLAGGFPWPGQLLEVVVAAFPRVAAHQPDHLQLGGLDGLGDEAVDHAVVGVGDQEAGRPRMYRGDSAVVTAQAPHERRHALAVGSGALDAVIERVAKAAARLLASIGPDPMLARGDVDTDRGRALGEARAKLLDARRRLLEGMEARIFGMRGRAVIAFEI